MSGILYRIWRLSDKYAPALVGRAAFRALVAFSSGPVPLDAAAVTDIAARKENARESRLRTLGYSSLTDTEQGRANMLSIGIFACNRFDLLKRTCDSFEGYLREYGSHFAHEVLLFHDGKNPEIEAWARAHPLFDRIYFNPRNHGLSKNINRFWFEESRGTLLLNLEDDWVCEYNTDFITEAADILANDTRIGCVRMGRREPDDYRTWDGASKIKGRVISASEYTTPRGHAYRLLDKSSYDNSCTLYRFSSLALTGHMRDDTERRRAQEGEYMREYDRYWMGARGARFEDSPFLHIGGGRSVGDWDA
jgi:hypothetical protein